MKPIISNVVLAMIAVIRLYTCAANAQGTFQNLAFELANLQPVPAGQYGGPVSSLNALPSWTCYLGTNQITTVLQNNLTLGNASISILGPFWNLGNIIEGQYTVVLQPGVDPARSGQAVGASISQVGLVPADTRSLQFKASAFSPFSVSLLGQNLTLVTLGTGANFALYGADISSLAGQTGTLTITALADPNTPNYFDSIVFSSSAIPEPSTLGLLTFGALLFGWRFFPKRP